MISWFNKGMYKEKDEDGNEILKPRLPYNDDPVNVVPLKNLWLWQETMNPLSPKGTSGMIFPFSFDKLYSIDYIKEHNLKSNGTVFLDLDCGKDLVQPIYDVIPKINEILCYNMICAAKTAKGIHVLFLSDPLTAEEYTARNFYMLASFTEAVKRVLNIDLSKEKWYDPKSDAMHGCLDSCTFTMKQRLWLRYCDKVYWFDNPIKIVPSDHTKAELRKLYPDLYKEMRSNLGYYDPVSSNNKVNRVTKCITSTNKNTSDHEYIEHRKRMRLFYSLCCCFRDDEENLFRQWERCCNLMAEGNGHTRKFFLNEPNKNKWLKRWDERKNKTPDQELLKEFGYNTTEKKTVFIFNLNK